MPLPWHLFPDDSPPRELEVTRSYGGRGGSVVAGGSEGCQGDSNDAKIMSDQQLHDSICRLERVRRVSYGRLSDNGAKLDARIRKFQEELERRSKPGYIDVDEVVVHERTKPAGRHLASSSLESPKSCSKSPSTFAALFMKGFETKTENRSCTSFKEEMSCMGRSNSTKRTSTFNEEISCMGKSSSTKRRKMTLVSEGRPKGKTSLKLPSLKQLTSIATGGKKENVDNFHRDKMTKNHTPVWPRISFSTKGKAREKQEKQSKSDQVLEVVVLDEDVKLSIENEQKDLGQKSNVKIHYPSRDHAECVELGFRDLKCLDPDTYLSSTIMNFYILYLQRQTLPFAKPRGEYYFFNTYFYSKLVDAVSSKDEKITRLKKLRRWFKGVNIFQKSYIFLPIHGNLHWSLVIVCIPAKEDETGPIILHLDSLGLHGSEVIFDNIESYLEEEWKHIKGTACPPDIPMSDQTWQNLPNKIVRRSIRVPQQRNEYDCGLFVLYFMERFMEEAPERVRKEHLAKFGAKWFQAEEASSLRVRIRELLTEEFESARLEDNTEETLTSSDG